MVEVYPTSRVFMSAAPAPMPTPTLTIPHHHSAGGITLTSQAQSTPRVLYILKPEIKPPRPQPTLPLEPLPQVVVTQTPPATIVSPAHPPPSGLTVTTSPTSAVAVDYSVSSPPAAVPLDLSNKQRHDSAASTGSSSFFDIGLGPRSNSCSSTSSSVFSDEDRKRKRKDQNKAAAHNYRQRKKSISEFIESEHDKLCRKNAQLKARKQQLETQITNMRTLLNQAAEKEAKQAELEKQQVASVNTETTTVIITGPEPRRRNMSAMAAITVPSTSMLPPPPMEIRPRSMSDVSPLMLPQHPSEDVANAMRERKNTWPVSNERSPNSIAAAAAAAVNGRERKKEQNKLASRRFRQRRKMELTNCEHQGQRLESRNKRLREVCDEMESKIRLLKDIMYKQNFKINAMGEGAKSEDVGEGSASVSPPPAPKLDISIVPGGPSESA